MTRIAVITNERAPRLETVQRFMPSNYTADMVDGKIVIVGEDVAGWTLEDYVLPRLASGGMYAVETNYWGTPIEDVGEGYCPQCEREGGRHFESCLEVTR